MKMLGLLFCLVPWGAYANGIKPDKAKLSLSIIQDKEGPYMFGEPIKVTLELTGWDAAHPPDKQADVELLWMFKHVMARQSVDFIQGKATAVFQGEDIGPGDYTVKASYPGDTYHEPCPAEETGLFLVLDPTETDLKVYPEVPRLGQQMVLIAEVRSLSQKEPLANQVIFQSNGIPLCIRRLSRQGQAVCRISKLPIGEHALSATYRGSRYQAPSRAEYKVSISNVGTAVFLKTSQNPMAEGAEGFLTAHVMRLEKFPEALKGRIEFKEDDKLLYVDSIDDAGQVIYSLQDLPAGVHRITAAYIPEGGVDLESTSPEVLQVVDAPVVDAPAPADPKPPASESCSAFGMPAGGSVALLAWAWAGRRKKAMSVLKNHKRGMT